LSESDSFIHEVSEEVRRDKLYTGLKRWGWLIALVLVAIVGGTGFVEWQKHQRQAAAEAAGDTLQSALEVTDPAERAGRLSAISGTTQGARLAARFARASALAEQGETQEAGEILADVSEDNTVPDVYRSMARLQRVMVLGDALDRSERLATLESLLAPEGPFRPLALEQRALVYLDSNEAGKAIADLEDLLVTPGATEVAVARARQLIVAAGGALPAEGPGGALAPVDG
jgi:hypothetical protein